MLWTASTAHAARRDKGGDAYGSDRYSTCKAIYIPLGSLKNAKERRPDQKRHLKDEHRLGIVSTVPDAHVLVTLSLIGRCTNITLVVYFNAIELAICSDFRSMCYLTSSQSITVINRACPG